MFDTFASSSFASTTGFSADQMAAAATSTIDTFGAATIGTFTYFMPAFLAGVMIFAIVGFGIVILRAFNV